MKQEYPHHFCTIRAHSIYNEKDEQNREVHNKEPSSTQCLLKFSFVKHVDRTKRQKAKNHLELSH